MASRIKLGMASRIKLSARRPKRTPAWTATPDRIASIPVHQSLLEQLGIESPEEQAERLANEHAPFTPGTATGPLAAPAVVQDDVAIADADLVDVDVEPAEDDVELADVELAAPAVVQEDVAIADADLVDVDDVPAEDDVELADVEPADVELAAPAVVQEDVAIADPGLVDVDDVPAEDDDVLADLEPDTVPLADVEAAAVASGWMTATDRAAETIAAEERARPVGPYALAAGELQESASPVAPATVEIPVAGSSAVAEPADWGDAALGLGDDLGLAEASDEARSGVGSRRRVVVVAGAAVLAVAIGFGAYALVEQRQESAAVATYDRELDAATLALADSEAEAREDVATPLADLQAAVDAAAVVMASSADQVADDAVRQSLQAAVDAAAPLLAAEVAIVYGPDVVEVDGVSQERPDVAVELATATTPTAAEVTAQTTTVLEATTAVTTARAEWFHDALGGAIQNARDVVLPQSQGKVADDTVRTTLANAVAEADLVWAAGTEGASLDESLAARQNVESAVGGVTSAQASWQQAEDARVAAEQAAAQQAADAAAAANAQASSPSATQPARPSPAASSPSQPAPTSAPAPAPAAGRVTSLSVSGVDSSSGSPGSVTFSVQVATAGQVSVSVRASVGGRSVTLSGSGGAGTYTGTVTGVPAGSQSWSVSGGGLSSSGSITVF